MIVVTAPTGNIGHQVLANLIDSGEPLRLVVRDPPKLSAQILGNAEIIPGSHSDRMVMEQALDGADKLFWLVPSDNTAESAEAAYVDFARPLKDLIGASSVSHIVSISALGRGWSGDAGHAAASIQMDDMLAATDVNYTTLACSSLMSNVARQAELIKSQGVFYYPTPPNVKLPHVAPQDVATLSSQLLLNADWNGFREIPAIGPEYLTFEEIAEIISNVIAKPVTFHEMSMDAMKGMMLENGASQGMAQAMIDMLSAKNEGMDHLVDLTPEDITNTPTTFRQWCETVLKPLVND